MDIRDLKCSCYECGGDDSGLYTCPDSVIIVLLLMGLNVVVYFGLFALLWNLR